MASRPSSSAASQLKLAISSAKEVHGEAHTLNEDIRELLEQIDMVQKLPESTNLSRIEGWRSRLLAKMRMKVSQNEDKYRHVVDVKWAKILATFKRDGPSSSSISYSFDDDLKLVQEFFDEAHRIASGNVLFNSSIRAAIPAVPYHVDLAISRLIADISALDIT